MIALLVVLSPTNEDIFEISFPKCRHKYRARILREIHAADCLSVADGGEKEEMRSVSCVLFSSFFVVVGGGGESSSSSSSKRVFYDPFHRGRRRRQPKAVSSNNNNDNDNNNIGRQQTKFSFENENK